MFNYWAPAKDNVEIARFLNDHLAQAVQKYPKRFVGLGTLPLQDPQASSRELERCVRELGLAGVQIGSHVNEWNLDDKALYPVYETAQKVGACLFVHPWDMLAPERMKKYWLPWLVGMPCETTLAICSMIFGGVFEKFPDMKVAFAHGGGAFPGTLGRIQHGFEARPDLCAVDNKISPRASVGKFYVDSLVHDLATLEFLVKTVGEDRIFLGSDYPFPLGEDEPGKLIESATLSPSTKQKLLAVNALRWLGRKESDFV